jgi:hypothetical protein
MMDEKQKAFLFGMRGILKKSKSPVGGGMNDLKLIPMDKMQEMLYKYAVKFNHTGSIGVSTRKDGLISVYSNKGKMLFNDMYEEVV